MPLAEERLGHALDETASIVAHLLGNAGIPHLITVASALRRYGVRRYTDNIDFIVPDPPAAYRSRK
jgi:hypothetical protein